ncbi:MAG: hypothetical protein J2P54_20910, partial [Bradyrhizobiaceae bacterium]|nr:hypothetical protein [Bradyrhizobiaceae bacterium]
MRRPVITFVPLTLGIVIAIGGLIMARDGTRAAEDCLEQPNGQAPQGGHWYYHTDRATNRKCWALRTDDGQVQGTQDTSDGTNEDTRAPHAPSQTASRPGSESAPPVPLRAPQSPSTQNSQRAQAPSAPASSAIEYNDPAFTPPWLRGGLMPTESTPLAAPSSPSVPPKRTLSVPASQTTDAPADAAPVSDDATGQIAPVDTQPAPQVVDEQKQEQIAPSSVDAKQEPGGSSAITLLQKAFQRLVTPAATGPEHNHTLALMISALALLTIGAGVVVAARWSLYREKKHRRALQWEADAQNEPAALFDGRDLHDHGRREPQSTENTVTEAEGELDLPEFLARAAIQPDSDQGAVRRDRTQHDAAPEIPDAPATQHHQTSAPRGLTYRERPADASHQPASAARERPLSTQAVEQTLRRLLQELDAKRSDRPASQPASPTAPDLSKETPDTYGAKRRNRGRMR